MLIYLRVQVYLSLLILLHLDYLMCDLMSLLRYYLFLFIGDHLTLGNLLIDLPYDACLLRGNSSLPFVI